MKKRALGAAIAAVLTLTFPSCKKNIIEPSLPGTTVLPQSQSPNPCLVKQDAQKTRAAMKPAPSASPVILLLDFNGQQVTNSNWLNPGTINCPAVPGSLLTAAMKDYITSSVAEDFSAFNVKVTKSESDYTAAPSGRRMRCVITHLMQGTFGNVGGASFVSSLLWADNTPCFIFCDELSYDQKYIAGAVTHELGHTFGLEHQSRYASDCSLVEEYHSGTGFDALGWAPVMGLSYYQNIVTWHTGASILGCGTVQQDAQVLSSVAGLKTDDFSSTLFNGTVALPSTGSKTGVLEVSTDKDAFQKTDNNSRRIRLQSGGNCDLALEVYNTNGSLQATYDDPAGVNVNVVISGKKYLRVRLSSNQPYVPAGDGFGGYTLTVSNP